MNKSIMYLFDRLAAAFECKFKYLFADRKILFQLMVIRFRRWQIFAHSIKLNLTNFRTINIIQLNFHFHRNEMAFVQCVVDLILI